MLYVIARPSSQTQCHESRDEARPPARPPPPAPSAKRRAYVWNIARAKYTLIYKANEASISNPNLIDPGQKFALSKPTAK